MKNYIIDSSEFQLPFLEGTGYILEEGIKDQETMLSFIPKESRIIGRTQFEVNNWTSWQNDDVYLIHPLHDSEWNYLLYRITWDDNWNCWAWMSDCRIKGDFNNYKKPAVIMLRECFKNWGIDISLPENSDYKKILNRTIRMKD
jgi:hypothetical protein